MKPGATAERDPVVAAFVARTTGASNVPERLENPTAIERIAEILRGRDHQPLETQKRREPATEVADSSSRRITPTARSGRLGGRDAR
jgi:hypothetical protein